MVRRNRETTLNVVGPVADVDAQNYLYLQYTNLEGTR